MQYSLTANGEYTAAIPTATNAGSYTVWYRVVGDANHTNVNATAIANVVISPKPLTDAAITVADQTYSGSALTPAVTVKDGETTLTSGTDYTVSYTDNTNVGTATVTVTYKGNYSGSQTATFAITAKSISDVAVTVADQTYTGSALTPTVTVKDGDKTLVLDTDYTVAYADNINAGTAGVTITGAGNYTGTKAASFTIKQATPTGAPTYTLIAESGKTLTDAALTLSGSTLSPNAGTLVWVDDDGSTLENDTIVEADTAYKWCFTPTDSNNYTTLTGLVMLYNASGISEIVNVADDINAVPDTLKGDSSLNTPEKIKTEMQGKLTAENSRLTASNTVFMDVTMTIIDGNGTVRSAKASDLVDGKITVLLPFPEAVKASYSKYNFTVAHMITMAGLSGVQVGDVEFPAVTVTADGLQVTLTGLSPVAVSYTETSSSGSSSGRRHYTSSIPAITAEKTSDKAASATDYTSGIYGLTFRSTASYASFKGVQVDGKTLAAENYIVEEGTIEVYLKAAYLQTLATGKHTVTILSSEGNASMNFTIGGVTTSPGTFDAGITMYVAMATASVTGMAWLGKKRED